LVQAGDESPDPASARPGPVATRPDALDLVATRLEYRWTQGTSAEVRIESLDLEVHPIS
jgi:hypothetical protein